MTTPARMTIDASANPAVVGGMRAMNNGEEAQMSDVATDEIERLVQEKFDGLVAAVAAAQKNLDEAETALNAFRSRMVARMGIATANKSAQAQRAERQRTVRALMEDMACISRGTKPRGKKVYADGRKPEELTASPATNPAAPPSASPISEKAPKPGWRDVVAASEAKPETEEDDDGDDKESCRAATTDLVVP